jgi:hypothetical protein
MATASGMVMEVTHVEDHRPEIVPTPIQMSSFMVQEKKHNL